jgi:hypothetical protein
MAAGHGLKHHMFYQQSAMFVAFFAESRPDAFSQFLTQLFNGVAFKNAFEAAYEDPVSATWEKFRKSLQSAEPMVTTEPGLPIFDNR